MGVPRNLGPEGPLRRAGQHSGASVATGFLRAGIPKEKWLPRVGWELGGHSQRGLVLPWTVNNFSDASILRGGCSVTLMGQDRQQTLSRSQTPEKMEHHAGCVPLPSHRSKHEEGHCLSELKGHSDLRTTEMPNDRTTPGVPTASEPGYSPALGAPPPNHPTRAPRHMTSSS